MDGAYSQRVTGVWSQYFRESYATALWVFLIVTVATVLAIKIDWYPLVKLTMSVLDIKPMLFFLLCWCVVRIIELAGATLFSKYSESGILANRLRDATSTSASVMIGAFFGAIAGLYLGTSEACAHPGVLLPLFVLFLVVAAPLALATGAFDLTESGHSKLAASWTTVILTLVFVLWMGHNVVNQESQPQKAVCPAHSVTTPAH
jgi:hypothetical protein